MNWAAVAQGAAQVAGQVAPAILNYRSQKKDREAQYDAAQNSISWRVQDARNAGIHPLFALGAQPYNMSPVSVGFQPMDFSSAFDMVANSKYNKELQKQTLEKNQLEIDGLKLRNQITYLQSVKPMRDTMGQSPAPSAPSQISQTLTNFENNTLNSRGGKSLGLVNKTADGLYRVVPLSNNNSVLTLKPSQEYSDYASESMPESYRNNMLLNDEAYANSVADHLTREYRINGLIGPDEFYVPKYNLKYLQYDYIRSKNSRFYHSFNSDYIDNRKKQLLDMNKRSYLRRNKPYYGE